MLDLFTNQHSVIQAWVWTMIHSIWIGLLLALVYYLFLNHNKSSTAKLKYNLGLFLMSLLPLTAFCMWWFTAPFTATILGPELVTGQETPIYTIATTSSLPSGISWMNSINQNVQSIFMVWCFGVIVLSLRMVMGYHEISRLKKSTIPIEHDKITDLFTQLLIKAGLKPTIALVHSQLVEMPMTIGHLKPIVILPIGLINQLSYEETKAILAHELAHILRKDYLQNLMMVFVEILFFFHPSIWWFTATLKSIREQCCDDLALSLGAERMALSKALVHLEEQTPMPVLAMAFAHKHQLLHRIQRLFDPQIKGSYQMSRSQAPMLLCSLAFLWIIGKPLGTLIQERKSISLLKSFLWEAPSLAVADTTKPKSKIEKITKDNGKQKLELKLEDQKITELKVDDKVIAPGDYEKYSEETESLRKELKEIEMPAPRAKAYTYSLGEPKSFSFSYDTDDDMIGTEFRNHWEDHDPVRVRVQPKVYINSGDRFPYVFNWYGEAPLRLHGKIRSLGSGSNDHIKYVIEGDSTGIIIDQKADRLILKDKKGDVIIDLGSPLRNHSLGEGRSLGRNFEYEGDRNMPKWLDELKEEYRLKSIDELQHSKELERVLEQDVRLKINKRMAEARSLSSESMLQQKRLMEDLHRKSLDEMKDKIFFKDKGDFDLLSGKGKLDVIIQKRLEEDQLIRTGDPYEFKITEKELRINGKKQNQEYFEKYKELIEDKTGFELKAKTTFEFSGSGKKG